jgi:hypothetical protein
VAHSFELRRRLASAPVVLLVSIGFAACVATYFAFVWRSPAVSLLYNAPIAAPFGAIFFDRLLPRPAARRLLLLDVAIIGLALLRVVAPPLPFASGHTLFTGYAAITARRWPLRLLAALVLLEVVYMKLFVTGGAVSMIVGLGLAAVGGWLHRDGVTRLDPAAPSPRRRP